MQQFVVSARKYRPTNFKDVIGQPHITTTLKNAIRSNQLAHAFLFCGPRGVGKTTCARILAKAINCLQLTETIEPCNHCTNCLSLHTNSAMNIHELDAASNNSVEDIRDLVEQVRYAPQIGKYKIYIIDEVHMLSNAAFNAFLKTLEEPPHYAIFILATTERHKVLPTILSRCQIFNFNSIQLETIVAQLKTIAQQESIPYEASALQCIAQKAEGAMRDALSMFDLLTTAVGIGGTLTYSITRDYLQLLDYDYYFKCTEAFLKGDIAAALALYDTILRAGFNGHHFVAGLGEHLRNILVCKDSATLPLLEVTDHIRPSYAEYASKCSMDFLLHALTRLNQCDIHYKASQHQRLHVELLLIELASEHLPTTGTETNPITPITLPDKENKKEISVAKPKPIDPSCVYSSIVPNPIQQYASPVTTTTTITPQLKGTIPTGKQETLAIPTLKHLKESLILKDKPSEPTPKKIETNANIKEPITKEMVQSFFADYKKKLKKEGNIAAYHLMGQPIEIQDQVITISLINPIQEHILQSLKEGLLAQLRKKLNDPTIIIQGSFAEQVENKKPYTDHEKLSYLSQKNTAIEQLQERFKLEIAY